MVKKWGDFVLIGEYQVNADAKGRVAVPAKFREDLGACFYITKGLDGCLFVLSQTEWEILEKKIGSMPISKARSLQRFFFSGAAQAQPDKQGRILLPQPLREFAELDKEITFIGAGNRCEIWSSAKWQQFSDDLSEESIKDAMDMLDL